MSNLRGGPPVEGVTKEDRRSAEVVVAFLLVVVSRAEPSSFTYLKHVFASETVDVILDRRGHEGRRLGLRERAATEKPDEDRRRRDITKDLQTYGWVVVRR